MFYLKFMFCCLWLIVSCTVAIITGFYPWRNPSGGYVFATLFCWGVARITGVKVFVKNYDRLLDHQPCVYVGNHQSNFDMLIQANCYPPRTVCIGKKEIIWIPFFGLLFLMSGNIFLDRKNHKRAIEGMEEAGRFIRNKKVSVYMFPEGTRNKQAHELLPFKKGAFRLAIAAQVPIIPVVSCPVKKFIDSKNRMIHPGTAIVEVLEAIPTIGLTENDIEGLLAKTYKVMQETYARLQL